MIRLALILIFMFVILISCNSSSGVSDEQLSAGEKIFRQNCQSCHTLPKPTDRTDSEWPKIVSKYGNKIKLNQKQIELIKGFLISNN